MRSLIAMLIAAGVLAGCGTSNGNSTDFSVSPASVTVEIGRSTTVTATGGDSTADLVWTSSNASIATVLATGASATVTGIAPGQTTIDVQLGAQHQGVAVTVVDAVDAIAVTAARTVIPLGETEQLTAQGHTIGDRSEDVTRSVTWTSQDPAIASVDSRGLVTVHAVGDTAITASQRGVTGTLAIGVTAAALRSIALAPGTRSLAKGLALPLTVNGTFSDRTVADVTAMATWTTSNAAVATVTAGSVQSVDLGPATITATVNGLTASAAIEVGPAIRTSISVVAPAPILLINTDEQASVIGNWSDGTTTDVTAQATWSVSGGAVTVSATGVVHGVANGNATIMARVDDQTGTWLAHVETPLRLTIGGAGVDLPLAVTIAQQQRVPLRAILSLTGQSAIDVTATATWSSSDPTIASLAPGQANTPNKFVVTTMDVQAQIRSGAATVTATASGFSQAVEVHVTAESCHPVINEALAQGASPSDEWVEIYNPCTRAFDVTGWTLVLHGREASAIDRTLVTLAGSMAPGSLRLYAGAGYPGTGAAAADGVWSGSSGVLDPLGFGVGLLQPTSGAPALVSGVAFGTVAQNPFLDGAAAPSLINSVAGGRFPFDGKDSHDNHRDFGTLVASPKLPNTPL